MFLKNGRYAPGEDMYVVTECMAAEVIVCYDINDFIKLGCQGKRCKAAAAPATVTGNENRKQATLSRKARLVG